jgi:ubiquinone biosynthesis protein UbiJ
MSNQKEIRSLEHTIKEHRAYILELQTKHYRGAVTDDRIETMNNQIKECQQTIEELKKGGL